jgi:hypothetical protein
MARRHLMGLLLATEEDWPGAFEAVLGRLGPLLYGGETHELSAARILNEPFDLRSKPGYTLVIDRLSWWYDLPREWLKKIALMDDVYLLNNPFTFQAMEKHAAYCAMMRLGLHVPETWLLPHRLPPDNPRYVPMAERYNPEFDLASIGEWVGYPLYMKPFDGGMGRSPGIGPRRAPVAHDASGERLMTCRPRSRTSTSSRAASIGAETMVMHSSSPADARPLPGRPRFPAETGEVVTISARTPSSGGSSTPARCWSRTGWSTRSTTPTPALTWRSRHCTTTSRGP